MATEKVSKTEKVELNHSLIYGVVSTGKSKHMPLKGECYEVSGQVAEILVSKGYATLSK